MRVAVLVGAGATLGAQSPTCRVVPTPPLGAGLFAALVAEFPQTWGAVSPTEATAFTTSFEDAMDACWQRGDQTATELLIDMGRYFARFTIGSDGSDHYTALIRMLATRGVLRRTTFASLNYECLRESTMNSLGLHITYSVDGGERIANRNVFVIKPHGSCNFLASVQMTNCAFTNVETLVDVPPRVVKPAEIDKIFDSGFSVPPAMSLYAPGKANPVCRHSSNT